MSGIKKILLVNTQGKTWPQAAARAGQLAARFHLPCVDGVTAPASWRGNAASAVLDVAERGGADLIVCPASDRHLVLERLAPSCALRIAGKSRAAVLLVNEKRAKAYRTVVVATDFSQASLSAAKTALALAPLAHFVFLHAYRLPDEGLMRELELPPRVIEAYRERGRAEAAKRLETLCGYFGSLVRSSSPVVRHGRLEHVLDGYARHGDADLIVIGKRSRHAMAWLGTGSRVARLINRPCCDMLIGAADDAGDSGRYRARARLAALGETARDRHSAHAAAKEN